MSQTNEVLLPLLYAGYDVLYVRTTEQERAYEQLVRELKGDTNFRGMEIYIWKANCQLIKRELPGVSVPSMVEVQRNKKAEGFPKALEFILSPEGMLDESEPGITDHERRRRADENRRRRERNTDGVEPPRGNSIYFFFNAKPYLNTKTGSPAAYAIVQTVRDIAVQLKAVGSTLCFIGDDLELPPELSDIVTFVDFPLPTRDELKPFFQDFINRNFQNLKSPITEEQLDMAADSMVGIPLSKAENAIALSVSKSSTVDLEILQNEKLQIIKQSGVLSWIRIEDTLDNLGGFDILKGHVAKRAKFFAHVSRARAFGLRPPKGVMLVGIGGTGKTKAAECLAHALGLPLYKLDMGAIFGGVVGASEANMRTALKMLEALAPCVVVFDEFEKAIAGLESSGRSDSGVTSRVVATLLSWMQDCKLPIYKVATCNSIRNLDGPLFRKGRWDEVFGVDLPTGSEREEIFKIHLRKRNRDPENFDLKVLVDGSDMFVGAEIEAAIEEGLFDAFSAEEELKTGHILKAMRETKPLAITDKEGIEAFREWVKERATNVSSARSTPAALTQKSVAPASNLRRVLQKGEK